MPLSDFIMDSNTPVSVHNYPVSQQLVLELLNHAVWAPNDGLREPWRFIYVDDQSGNTMLGLQESAPAHLIMVMKEDSDHHKRDEDFAAVCCLIQNFQLLAREKKLGVRRTMPEWIYDRERTRPFGVQEKERIVAILDLGAVEQTPTAASAATLPEPKFELL
ncbi:hypothetical protein [Paenibacillus monticola]|uniref:Nitroreductase domain-containing protein n=1 Tax=Paenibacillus monticola TaxID=2666075 RepID=A0A7X2L3M8_9BACL|nr:hypothetical protein [Paenibacillus monticola]MRN56122.1 hypothetical protein [Paenibacillus monticola]